MMLQLIQWWAVGAVLCWAFIAGATKETAPRVHTRNTGFTSLPQPVWLYVLIADDVAGVYALTEEPLTFAQCFAERSRYSLGVRRSLAVQPLPVMWAWIDAPMVQA